MNAEQFIQKGRTEGFIRPTESMEPLTIDGRKSTHRVYEVKVDSLRYNVKNGRIATFISRYKQEVGELPSEGEEMNALVESFIEEGNPQRLRKTKLDIKIKGQQRPAVVLSDGTVIDGNRRFTCLRQLQREDGDARHLRCFILDSALDDISLKGMELELQFGQDEKVPYDPISRLVDVYEWCRMRHLDPEYYREKCGMTKSEMDSLLGQADLMVEFLQFINADGQFHVVQDLKLQGPLEALYGALRKCPDRDKAEDLKVAVFANCLTKSVGDSTRHVRRMCEIAFSPEGDDFLEEQILCAQGVLEAFDDLPDGKDVSVSFINDVVRANSDAIRKQNASFEQAQRLVNSEKIKDSQTKEIEKARICLEKVEAELIPKLSQEALSSLEASLAEIASLARSLSEAVRDAKTSSDSDQVRD